jgi:hypothetical protein
MVNLPVLKAFLYDLATTVITLVVGYLSLPENVSKMGVADTIVPIIVGLAGAAGIALRRYHIIQSGKG